jgi:hypothetical protein
MRSQGKFNPLNPLRYQIQILVRGDDCQAAIF